MSRPSWNLAIETSGRLGSVTLGRDDEPVRSVDLPEQRRHAVDLMPAIDALFRAHALRPDRLAEIYISIGPGSFTGLRIGVSTAKLLAYALGCRLIAVPTMDAVALNAPDRPPHIAVLLNAKSGRYYAGLYDRRDEGWAPRSDPALMTAAQLLAAAPRPLAVIADAHAGDLMLPPDVRRLDPALANPRSEAVWRLGRARAAAGRFTDPPALTPLYIRLPEAEQRWQDARADSRYPSRAGPS